MTIEEWGMPIAITMLAVGVRCSFDEKHASLSGIFQSVLLGILVGSITNLYFIDYVMDNGQIMSHTKRAAIVGITSALSQELYTYAKNAVSNPVDLFRRILNK